MTTPPTLHSKVITVSQWKHSYIIIYNKFIISYTAFIEYLLLVLLSQVRVEYTDETPQQFVSEMNEFIKKHHQLQDFTVRLVWEHTSYECQIPQATTSTATVSGVEGK